MKLLSLALPRPCALYASPPSRSPCSFRFLALLAVLTLPTNLPPPPPPPPSFRLLLLLLLLPISRLESVAQEVIKSFNRYIHFDFISSFSNPRHVGRRQEGRMRQRASHSILPQCAGPQEADSGTWVGLACQLPGAFSVRRQINAKEKNIQAQARPAVPPS